LQTEERSDEKFNEAFRDSGHLSMPDSALMLRKPERLKGTTNLRQPATFDACAL